MTSWKNKRFVKFDADYGPNWKKSGKTKVAATTHGDRTRDFLTLMNADGFTMFLEKEADNPVDPNAQKVMVSGGGKVRQIGYLLKEVAEEFAGVEIAIVPAGAFIPGGGYDLGVEVWVLERSARYLKKQKKA